MALLEMQIGCLALNGIPARQGEAYDGKSTIDIMAPLEWAMSSPSDGPGCMDSG